MFDTFKREGERDWRPYGPPFLFILVQKKKKKKKNINNKKKIK